MLQNYREILPKRWLEYLHALGQVEGKNFRRYVRNGIKESESIDQIVCLFPLFLETRDTEKGESFAVKVDGKNYSFYLERNNPNDKWTLERNEMVSSDTPLDSWQFPKHFSTEGLEVAGYDIFITLGHGLFADGATVNLPEILKSKYFKAHQVKFIENEGKRQLFIDFDYIHDGFPERLKNNKSWFEHNYRSEWKPFSLRGQVYLETEYYLISKATFHTQYLADEYHSEVECEYDCNTYRVPLPKKYKLITRYDYFIGDEECRKQGVVETYIDFDLRETNPKDPKRFTLSAFGLPEPDFGPRRMSLFRIVMMSLGGIMVLLALWLMYLKRL